MIASAHIVAGAVAGLAATRFARGGAGLVAAFALGIVSHHVLDAIPHSDYAGMSVLAVRLVGLLEIALSLGLIFYAARGRANRHEIRCIIAGIAGGAVMDIKFLQPIAPAGLRQPIERIQEVLHPFHAADHDARLLGLGLEIACLVILSAVLIAQLRIAARAGTRDDVV